MSHLWGLKNKVQHKTGRDRTRQGKATQLSTAYGTAQDSTAPCCAVVVWVEASFRARDLAVPERGRFRHELGQHQPDGCRHRPRSGRNRPENGGSRSTVGANSAKFAQRLSDTAKVCLTRTISAVELGRQLWPSSARWCREFGPNLVRVRSIFDRRWSKCNRTRPTLDRPRKRQQTVARSRAKCRQSRTKWVNIGRNSAQFKQSVAQRGPTVAESQLH